MNKITSKIIESIESKFQYQPLLNNRSVVAYYLDNCLNNVDENSEVMIINDNNNLKINIELANDSVISIACDENKIAGVTSGNEAVVNEPLFVIYTYGTKIVCDECKKVEDNIVKTQSIFDFEEIASSIKENVNGEEIVNGSIKPINAIIGERALFSIENNLKRKSKTTSLPKDGISIDTMYDSLYAYIGYEPVNNQAKTL